MIEHGAFQITVEDNLLISQFFGAWNCEQTKRYAEQVKLAAQHLLAHPWARIVNLTNWEGGGEEVIAPLENLHSWSLLHNCCFVVFISPSLVPKFLLKKHGELYGEYRIFDDLAQGQAWVKEQLLHSQSGLD